MLSASGEFLPAYGVRSHRSPISHDQPSGTGIILHVRLSTGEFTKHTHQPRQGFSHRPLSLPSSFVLFCQSILMAWSFWRQPSTQDAALSTGSATSTTLTPAPKRRRYRPYRSAYANNSRSLGDVLPALSTSNTVDSALDSLSAAEGEGTTSRPTSLKDNHCQSKGWGAGRGVQIIRRPEEAFKDVRIKPGKPRSTISTWGF